MFTLKTRCFYEQSGTQSPDLGLADADYSAAEREFEQYGVPGLAATDDLTESDNRELFGTVSVNAALYLTMKARLRFGTERGRRQMEYDAFISYAQGDDTRIATALQDGLHRLAKRWESLSSLRVFRDATNLQLAGLQPSIQEALADSRFLILLASPKSAKRGWVKEEVTTFHTRRSSDNILIVMTGGELVWDDSAGDFQHNDLSAFPNLGRRIFSEQPLFLDLCWATSDQDLSLSNPRFLDAVATLAATLKNVPKEALVGSLVEEQARLRRNQRLNLGFRGTIGFGVVPFLMIVLVKSFESASEAFSPASYLFFLSGFLATGAVGALCCGVRWRGVIGFALGFVGLLPCYLLGSLCPFSGSVPDSIVFFCLSVVGFWSAGAVGALFARETGWRAGGIAFAFGGLVVALLWLCFPGWHPDVLRHEIVSGPWLITRIWIAIRKTVNLSAGLFHDGSSIALLPFVIGAPVGGLCFGLRLADCRVALPLQPGSFLSRQFAVMARSRWLRYGLGAIVALLVAVWFITLTTTYQVRRAAKAFDQFTVVPSRNLDGFEYDKLAQGFVLLFRARRAFEAYGDRKRVEKSSALIRQWIDAVRSETLSYDDPGGHPVVQNGWHRVDDFTEALTKYGTKEELDQAIHIEEGAADDSKISAARVLNALGKTKEAQEALQRAHSQFDKGNSRGNLEYLSLLAEGFYEVGQTETARALLRQIRDKIVADVADHIKSYDRFDKEIGIDPSESADLPPVAPSSGHALWGTGVWDELAPAWRGQLGVPPLSPVSDAVVEDMLRGGKLEVALKTFRENGGSTLRLARTAARAGKYDAAFAILDTLGIPGKPGWTGFDKEASGLYEIVSASAEAGNKEALTEAVARLKILENWARRNGKLNYYFTGVELCAAYAVAGAYAEAIAVARDLTEDKEAAYRSIGASLAKHGMRREARAMLAKAWEELQLNGVPGGEEREVPLSDIGSSLAMSGDLRAARFVAEEIGPASLSQLSVYCAILEADAPMHLYPRRHSVTSR